MRFRDIKPPLRRGRAVEENPSRPMAARRLSAPREELIMTGKLAFQLSDTNEPDRYVIRLVDRRQIAALAQSEGLSTRIPIEPVAVIYDEGSGELVPAHRHGTRIGPCEIREDELNRMRIDA